MRITLKILCGVSSILFCVESASAKTICDNMQESLSQDQIEAIYNDIRRPFPAIYSQQLRKISIENSQDNRNLAPFAEWNVGSPEKATIKIPHGFKKLNCKLIISSIFLMRDRFIKAQFETEMKKCVSSINENSVCLNMSLDNILEPFDISYDKEEAYQQSLLDWINSSFNFAIAHEVSHILLAPIPENEREEAADIQAAIALSIDGDNIRPAIALFRMWSVADPYIDWKTQNHASSRCRAESLAEILKHISSRAWKANSWNQNRGEFQAEFVDWKEALFPDFSETQGCLTTASPRTKRISDDIDRLLDVLEKVSNSKEDSSSVGIKKIANVMLETDEAKGIRADIVARWVGKFLIDAFSEGVIPEEIESGVEDGDTISLHEYRALKKISIELLNLAETQLDPKYVSSVSYGENILRVLQLRDVIQYRRVSTVDFRKYIPLLELYSPSSPSIFYMQGLLAYKRGDCENGKNLLQLAVKGGVELHESISEYAAGASDKEDCRELRKWLP